MIFQVITQKSEIDEFPVFYTAEEEKVEYLESFGIEKIKKGIILGPEATFLNEALTNRIEAYALFIPVSQYPTPEGAAAIIEILNKIFNMEVDTTRIIEQGKNIKKKMLELAEKVQQYQRKRFDQILKEEYNRYFLLI